MTEVIIIVTVGACCFAFGWIAGYARGIGNRGDAGRWP